MSQTLKQWLSCLIVYLQMCLFKASPARLPHSFSCLALTLLAYVLTGEVLLGAERSTLSIILQVLIELAILTLVSYIVLRYSRHSGRLLQTLTALSGVSLVISLVSIPVQAWLPPMVEAEQVDPLTLQVNLIMLLWNLAVISLIFKRSFEINTMAAGFLAFNYFLLYELILLNFF